jgi:hypothetical protein
MILLDDLIAQLQKTRKKSGNQPVFVNAMSIADGEPFRCDIPLDNDAVTIDEEGNVVLQHEAGY